MCFCERAILPPSYPLLSHTIERRIQLIISHYAAQLFYSQFTGAAFGK